MFIIGNTGSGKSTLINGIAGRKIVKKKNEKGVYKMICENPLAEIGSNEASKTFLPSIYKIS